MIVAGLVKSDKDAVELLALTCPTFTTFITVRVEGASGGCLEHGSK